MTSKSENIKYLLLTILFVFSELYILFYTNYYYLIFIPFILYVLVINIIKNNKAIITFVKDDFKKLGYELISERKLGFSESELEIKPAALNIGNTPRRGYKNKYNRVFKAINKKGNIFELVSVIIEKKNGEIEIEIKSKNKVSADKK